MAEAVGLFSTLLGTAISVFAAFWVWQDARRLKKNGACINPWLWAALVFVLWLVSLPLYLYLRRTTWQTTVSPPLMAEMAAQGAGQHQLGPSNKVEFRVIYWVISSIFAVMLSMYATWFAISRYPVPDSDAINLGFFLFFLIELFSLLIIGNLIIFGLREGRRLEPGLMIGIFIGGSIIAAMVGLLTWGTGWFVAELVADMPWVPQVFRTAAPLLTVLYILWLRRYSRAPSNPGT